VVTNVFSYLMNIC